MPRIPGGWRAKYLELMTRSLAGTGRRRDAEAERGPCRGPGRRDRPRMAAAWADRATAAVALDGGQTDGGRACAVIGCVVRRGRSERRGSRLPYGWPARALAQTGERDRAVAELERAVATLEDAGARSLPARGRARAREARARASPAYAAAEGRTGPASTRSRERELELARLVVDRRTNPEIAAALFLSQKTVETTCGTSSASSASPHAWSSPAPSSEPIARQRGLAVSAGVGRNLLRLARRRRSIAACRPRSG